MFRQIDVNDLNNKIKASFKLHCRDIQSQLVAYINGIYNAQASRGEIRNFPAIMTKSGIGTGVNITAHLGKVDNKFYTIFQEYGTGLYMDKNWSPSKTEAVINANRSMARNGKMISPRGKNSPWVDYGGVHHPGHNVIVFEIGGEKIIVSETKGSKPQKLLSKKMDTFLKPVRLKRLMTSVMRDITPVSTRIRQKVTVI